MNLLQLDVPAIASRQLYEFIGSGRTEAQAIAPVRDQLVTWITDAWRRVPVAGVDELQALMLTARQHLYDFRAFVADPAFADGRAGQLALAEVEPMLDQLIAELQAAILARGGNLAPALPVVQGSGTNIPTVDPGAARYGLGLSSTLPQAGWLPPSVMDVWRNVTGRAYTGIETAGASAGGGVVPLLLLGGALWLLMSPKPRRRAGHRRR